MQMHTLVLSVLLVAAGAGCKNKQELPEAAATPAPPPTTTTTTATPPDGMEEETGHEQTPKATKDSLFFSLERTPCFGSCPTYKVTIYRNGDATYFGRRFAAREGHFTGHVSAALMDSLASAAETHGFFAMEDKYDEPVTDLPSVIIRVHADGKAKQVIGRVGAPQGFKLLTKKAEKLLGAVEWTPVEEKP